MTGRRPATLQDVADAAGVSLATASRALNGGTRRVKDEYRERVEAAADRLGYSVNSSAQSVALGRARSIALVVSDIADPYFSQLASGAFRAAARDRLVVTLAMTEWDPARELDIVRELRGQRHRAIILSGSRVDDEDAAERLLAELLAFESEGGRVIVLGRPGLPFATLEIDNAGGAAELARRLSGLGYERIAVLGGPARLDAARSRVGGLVTGFAAAGVAVDPSLVVESDFTRDGGYAAAGEVLERIADVDLVVAVNDVMAVGAMTRLREAGVAVPGDLAVAGFDDIAMLRDVAPSLTTVRLPLEDMGERALVLATVEGRDPVREVVSGEVVLRDSTPSR
ncbi:LacI family DNA-binding transcriptional regulator [Labedella gwakjiensis]|uniref:LacI family transcriptional regulator n=1 Tax=Labedella gwakjiensis TaxID=390269 RepID=A0ABY0C4E8_9MICO|nr:LacI family DNA-binding transcriptional regulator [Labedella gwakjiensis]RUQ81705.1 LacI family transcriptional regulator [Labedella gwakjiensis]